MTMILLRIIPDTARQCLTSARTYLWWLDLSGMEAFLPLVTCLAWVHYRGRGDAGIATQTIISQWFVSRAGNTQKIRQRRNDGRTPQGLQMV